MGEQGGETEDDEKRFIVDELEVTNVVFSAKVMIAGVDTPATTMNSSSLSLSDVGKEEGGLERQEGPGLHGAEGQGGPYHAGQEKELGRTPASKPPIGKRLPEVESAIWTEDRTVVQASRRRYANGTCPPPSIPGHTGHNSDRILSIRSRWAWPR